MSDSGGLLVRYGLISRDQLASAEGLRLRQGGTIGECLARLGIVDEERLADFWHRRLMVPLLGPRDFEHVQRRVIQLLPADMALEFRVFPVDVDVEGSLTLAMANPSDTHIVDEVMFFTNRFCQRAVAPESLVRGAIERYYSTRVESIPPPPGRAPSRPPPVPSRPPPPSTTAEDPVVLLTQVKRVENTPLPPPLPQTDELELVADDEDGDDEMELPGVSVVELIRRKQPSPQTVDEGGADEPILLDRPVPAVSRIPTLQGLPRLNLPDPPLAALHAAGSRDAVAASLLDYLGQLAPRAILFVTRKALLVGHDARGSISSDEARRVEIAIDAPSLFRDVMQARLPYRGPLPPSPANEVLARLLGALDGDVLLLPIGIRDRVVALAYADGIESVLPDAALHAVTREAGMAYERLILAGKKPR